MHSDTLSSFSGVAIYSIIGLVLFFVAFGLIIVRVVRMDPKDIDTLSRMPLDGRSAASNGDTGDE